jgi:hypothetical protein
MVVVPVSTALHADDVNQGGYGDLRKQISQARLSATNVPLKFLFFTCTPILKELVTEQLRTDGFGPDAFFHEHGTPDRQIPYSTADIPRRARSRMEAGRASSGRLSTSCRGCPSCRKNLNTDLDGSFIRIDTLWFAGADDPKTRGSDFAFSYLRPASSWSMCRLSSRPMPGW